MNLRRDLMKEGFETVAPQAKTISAPEQSGG
jgi:hypothetical protein